MNQNLTDITVILDRSGSMQRLVPATISGYNEFKAEQAAMPGQCNWTEVQFSSKWYDEEPAIRTTVESQPVQKVRNLSTYNYLPSGGTALLDAIGSTIDATGRRLTAMPEEERPGTVIIVITTDGEENSSKTYNREQIKSMIEHQQNKYNWQFVFLAANQDAIQAGASMGTHRESTMSVAATPEGYKTAYSTLSTGVARARTTKSAVAFTEKDRELQRKEGAVN